MFPDISKAFNRVPNDGLLLFKLKQNGINGNLFQLIKRFLSGRFQRVLLNGQTSDLETIQAGVPQDSVLGPLFFIMYINDLRNSLNSNVKLFVDESFLVSEVCDHVETANALNSDLQKVREWAEQLKIVLNIDSTKQACPKYLDLYFNSPIVEEVKTQKHLGLKLVAKTQILGNICKTNLLLLIMELGC